MGTAHLAQLPGRSQPQSDLPELLVPSGRRSFSSPTPSASGPVRGVLYLACLPVCRHMCVCAYVQAAGEIHLPQNTWKSPARDFPCDLICKQGQCRCGSYEVMQDSSATESRVLRRKQKRGQRRTLRGKAIGRR